MGGLDRLIAEHMENLGGSLEQWSMWLVMTVIPASLWLLVIARGFDRATVEGAMTITGWAILGTVPAGLLARRRYWRTAVAVGLVCVVILPGGWWSLQVELSEPQPLSGTVQRAPAAPFGASFARTAHLGGPTSFDVSGGPLVGSCSRHPYSRGLAP